MYLVFTRRPGESYRRRLRSLLLYLCYIFRTLINSLCVDCVQFSSVQLKMVSMRSEKPIILYALHSVSQKVPPICLWNYHWRELPQVSFLSRQTRVLSSVPLTDDGPLSSFQGISSNTSSFHASLLQAIVGVMSLASYLLVLSQAPQHFRSSEKKPLVRVALPVSLSARSFPFTPACPGQYTLSFFPRFLFLIVTIAWTARLVTLFLLDLDQFCIPF